MARKKYKPPTLWEIAKPLLTADILDNTVTASMAPSAVVLMRHQYFVVKYANFCANFLALKKKLGVDCTSARDDDLALQNDRLLHPIDMENPRMAYPCWDGHPAQRLLKEDIDDGKHLGVTPAALRETKEEYKAFPLSVFRKHIHQEVRSRVETPYWLEYKAKKRRRAALLPGEIDEAKEEEEPRIE